MHSSRPYQICTRCVMDTTAHEISFDAQGICSFCNYHKNIIQPNLDAVAKDLDGKIYRKLIDTIRERGRGHEYDCILGLSGGVDSSYLAYLVHKEKLRVLAVHCDSGWNSELAVSNIESIVKKLGIDLYTYVIDWEEMRDLQLSFFKSGVANCDTPQDHAFLAVLHRIARERGIKTILSGSNFSTEAILPISWGYQAADLRQLKDIQRKFGKAMLRSYPLLSILTTYFINPFLFNIKTIRPLNAIIYNKDEAKETIRNYFSWRDYGQKHFESQFTKFFQSYYLVKYFGYDKRRAHLASLVLSGQLSREEALEQLKNPAYDEQAIQSDIEFVAKKLGLNKADFENILAQPKKSYKDYKNDEWLFKLKDYLATHLKFKETQRHITATDKTLKDFKIVS